MLNIVILEPILHKMPSFMEQTEGNDRLGDANPLSPKDTPQTKGGHIGEHFLDGARDGISLAVNRVGLHNDFETGKGVGDKDVNGRNDGRRDEARGGAAQRRLVAQFFLNVFLQAGLSDESEESGSEGVSHEGDGAAEEGGEALGSGFFENLGDGLGGAGLFKVSALLFFNHADGVDEGSAEDGRGGGSGESWVLSFAEEEGEAEENAKLGDALETDADEAGSDA